MNHYKLTLASQYASATLLVVADSVSDVEQRFTPFVPAGWSLTVESVL